jgi:hypothetical protein
MKALALPAAAASALIALAACSSPAPSATAHVRHVTDTHRAVLVNCPKEYAAWKLGPGKKVVGALDAVDSANTAGDVPALRAALKQAGSEVTKAARFPIPACADPKGYWTALLMHVNAAAESKGPQSGVASIALALAGVPKIEHELNTELKSTAGVR